jgi:hypothetical protein
MPMLGVDGSGYRARCEALNERPSSFRSPFEHQKRVLAASSAGERQSREAVPFTSSIVKRDPGAATAERPCMPV